MHLRNNHPFRAIDHEGSVVGHQRQVAHIDVLLLDIADRTCAGFFIDVKNDEP